VKLRRPSVLVLLVFFGLLSLVIGCSSTESTGTTGTVKLGSKVGQRIPDIAINLIDGSIVESSDLIASGQPTFLFFFATW
jgi:hypothetical protein